MRHTLILGHWTVAIFRVGLSPVIHLTGHVTGNRCFFYQPFWFMLYFRSVSS